MAGDRAAAEAVIRGLYERRFLNFHSGFTHLHASHRSTRVGICVVEGELDQGKFEACREEARRAGLNTERIFICASSSSVNDKGLELIRLPVEQPA